MYSRTVRLWEKYTLRLLAGLEQPTTGEILMQGVSAEGASLDKGVVFQDYGLFPWMKAGENILLALRQRFPKKDKKELKQTSSRDAGSSRT